MAIVRYAGNRMTGLSSDTKPTEGSLLAGTTFHETNTDDLYMWDGDSWNVVASNTVAETLSSKTLTSPVLNTSLSGTAFLDEDNFASDAADKAASQQSIKAYIATQVSGSQNVFSTVAVSGQDNVVADATTDTLTLAGAGGMTITTNASNDTITFTSSGGGTLTVTDNEAVNENNLLTFVADAGTATGAHALEMDGDLHYNPSTGTLTSTVFVGALTGNASGTAATVTTAAQTNITSLGTLTALQVDNLNINGNTISSTAGTDLLITPLAGQQIVLDGTIIIDAGVVTGATSITSTAFVGALTGDASGSSGSTTGNAATATALATARTIGGTSFDGTGNIAVALAATATILATARTIGGTSFDGSANIVPGTATALATGRTIGMTGDVTWTSASFDGSGNVTGTAAIASDVIVNADVKSDAAIAMSKTALVAGTGITLATNTLNVDAAQTQITSVGALDAGSISSNFGAIDTGSSNITTSGTIQGATITATTAFVPDASDGAALGTASLEFSDLFLADEAVVSFGDDDDVTLTHVHNTGLLISSTDKLQFGDAGTFIHQSSDGVLTIESDTTVDINGAVVFGGALSGITTLGASGIITSAGLTMGSATMVEADLERVEDITPGTAAANKAVVLDGSKNIATIGTISAGTTTIGTLVVAAASITDTSGAISFGDENLTTTGVVTATGFTIGSAAILEAELEILDGATVTTAELNLLDGVTSTTAELNILDGVTSTAAELNLLDGVSGLIQADLTKLAAVDSSAAELNKLDGASANVTAANLNILTDSSSTTSLHAHAGGGGDFTNGGDNGALVLGTNDSNSLTFETNNTARITIESGGDVGIHTTAPETDLHIKYDGTDAGVTFEGREGLIIERSNETGLAIGTRNSDSGFLSFAAPQGNNDGGLQYSQGGRYMNFYAGGTVEFKVYSTGDIHDSSGAIHENSDERIKENVVNSVFGLAEVLQLRPVNFNYCSWYTNGEPTPLRTGFIAQEVKEIIPNVVKIKPHDTPFDFTDLDGTPHNLHDPLPEMHSIQDQQLIPILVKAIQELNAKIDALHA